MFNWLWENLKSFGLWLFNLPAEMGASALSQLAEELPDTVLADIEPFIEWLAIADKWVPLSEIFGMMTSLFAFEVIFVGVRFVYKLIRGS